MARIEFIDALREGLAERAQQQQQLQQIALIMALRGQGRGSPLASGTPGSIPARLASMIPRGFTQGLINRGMALGPGEQMLAPQDGLANIDQLVKRLSETGTPYRITHKVDPRTTVVVSGGKTEKTTIPSSTATGLITAEEKMQKARTLKTGFPGFRKPAFQPEELSAMQRAVELLKARVNAAQGISEETSSTTPQDPEQDFVTILQNQGFTVEPLE